MGKRYNVNGAIYEEQNGQYVLVDQSPAAPVGGGMVIKPADQVARALQAAELAAKAREAARAPIVDRKDRAEADRAEAEAIAARAKAGQNTDPRKVQLLSDLNQDATYRAIQQAEGDVDRGGLPSTGLFSYLRHLPNTNAQLLGSDLDTINSQNTLRQLMELKQQSATGASGMGALSDTEGRILRDSIANLDQSLPRDRLKANLKYIEDHYRRASAIAHGLDPDRVDVSEALPAGTVGQSDQTALAQGKTKGVEDPVLRGVAAHVGSMLADPNTSDDEIRSYMSRAGVNPADTTIDEAFRLRRTPGVQAWLRKHPGTGYPMGKSFYTKQVPLTPIASVVNQTAQSPFGAYAINAGEGVTANHLDNIAGALGGNAEQVRAGEDLVRAQHPYASLAGDVSGQIIADQAMSIAPAARALLATKWGRRAGDAVYGAAAGQGSNDDNPGAGMLTGAFTNALGGGLGRKAQQAAGVVVGGMADPALQYLHSRRIPLTIGQIARSGSDNVGKVVAGLEDRVSGYPVIGDFIKSARRRGSEGFNREAFDQGLAPIGQKIGDRTGGPAIDRMQYLTGEAYNQALDGLNLPHDQRFATDYASAKAAAAAVPEHGPKIVHMMETSIEPYLAHGTLSGSDLQATLRRLKMESASFSGVPGGQSAADAIGNVEDSLTGLVARQSPETVPALRAANQAYGNQQILQNAVRGSRVGAEELFTPGRLRTSAISNTTRFGGANQAASTGRPFYDLAAHGDAVLPSTTPDSGSAGRWLIPAAAMSVGGGAGAYGNDQNRAEGGLSGAAKAAFLVGGAALPYSRTGQKAIQALLLGQRLKAVQVTGELLRKYPWLSGRVGAGVARDAVMYPEAEPGN